MITSTQAVKSFRSNLSTVKSSESVGWCYYLIFLDALTRTSGAPSVYLHLRYSFLHVYDQIVTIYY